MGGGLGLPVLTQEVSTPPYPLGFPFFWMTRRHRKEKVFWKSEWRIRGFPKMKWGRVQRCQTQRGHSFGDLEGC